MPKIDWRARAAETQLSVRNFINGQYQDCVGSETIEKYAGRDGQLLYKFACGDGSEVELAVANARATFNDGCWRNLSSGERGAVLNRLADLIDRAPRDLGALREPGCGQAHYQCSKR